jgi:hypothetical protein
MESERLKKLELIKKCEERIDYLSQPRNFVQLKTHGPIEKKNIYQTYFKNIINNLDDYKLIKKDNGFIFIKNEDLEIEAIENLIKEIKFHSIHNYHNQTKQYELDYEDMIAYMQNRKKLLNEMKEDHKIDLLGVTDISKLEEKYELINPYPKEYDKKLKVQEYKFYLEPEYEPTEDKTFWITKNDSSEHTDHTLETCSKINEVMGNNQIICQKSIDLCSNTRFMPEKNKFGINNLYRQAVIGANYKGISEYYLCPKNYIARNFFTEKNPLYYNLDNYRNINQELKYSLKINKIFVQNAASRKLIFPIMFLGNQCNQYLRYDFSLEDIKGLIIYNSNVGFLIYFIILNNSEYKVVSLWKDDSLLNDFIGERMRICYLEYNIAYYTIQNLYGKCYIYKIKDEPNFLLSRFSIDQIKELYKYNSLSQKELESLEEIQRYNVKRLLEDNMKLKLKYLKYRMKYLLDKQNNYKLKYLKYKIKYLKNNHVI